MPVQSPIDESRRVLEAAALQGVTLRLLGGVAFFLRCPSARRESMTRSYGDIDFTGHARQSSEMKSLFTQLGYVPRDRFNAMQGYRRLMFVDPDHRRRVDIFLDVFEMCHKFDLKGRMELDKETLTLADLLATKLQIVKINEKDIRDIICLLIDHEVGRSDSEVINGSYLARICGGDWGVYKTFTINLDRLVLSAESGLQEPERGRVLERIATLKEMIEAEPKSLGWKARAAIGERVRWYELPEEDALPLAQESTGSR